MKIEQVPGKPPRFPPPAAANIASLRSPFLVPKVGPRTVSPSGSKNRDKNKPRLSRES